MLGQVEQVRECFERVSTGLSKPTSVVYYNEQPPDMIYYLGLVLQKLNRNAEDQAVFARLIAFNAAHLDDEVNVDYFAAWRNFTQKDGSK